MSTKPTVASLSAKIEEIEGFFPELRDFICTAFAVSDRKIEELESKLADALARIDELDTRVVSLTIREGIASSAMLVMQEQIMDLQHERKGTAPKRPAPQAGEPVGQPFRRADGKMYQKFRVGYNTTATRCIEEA